MTDFNHALAVQATSDQTSHFPELTKSTETARKLAQELAVSVKADSSTDFSGKTAALKDAVEEAQGGNQDFVKSFTKSQKAGLKELTKKLEKADSEVAKQWKDLEKQLGERRRTSEGIAGTAEKLEKALEEFQSQQIGLGKEMGIQTPATVIRGYRLVFTRARVCMTLMVSSQRSSGSGSGHAAVCTITTCRLGLT